ncbi:MAG: hypothetical protein R2911_11680 [Caldilineaceae bacterium]
MAESSFYQFQGDPDDEAAWQAFVAANSESTGDAQAGNSSSATVLKSFYHLILILVIGGAFAGTVLWQQNAQQITALETEVQTLEKQLADSETAQANEALSHDAAPSMALTSSPAHQVIETQFLRLVVEAGMANVANAIAPELDYAYSQLRADLGLAGAPVGEKISILLVNDGADYAAGAYAELGVIVVDWTSYGLPGEEARREFPQVVYSDLYCELAQRLLQRALMVRHISPSWAAVITHLYSFVEQDPISTEIEALPAHEVQQRQMAQLLSPNTALLSKEPADWMYPDYMLAHAAADSLVEYILMTYGRESVPRLLDAMSGANNWNAVAPAAFGIPPAQFEAEWRAYLAAHYPTDAD